MKTRACKAYLVMGTGHLGVDQDILAVFAQVAAHYKAKAVHIGPLLHKNAVKKYRSLEGSRESEHVAERRGVSMEQASLVDSLVRAFGSVSLVVNSGQFVERPNDPRATIVMDQMDLSRHLHLTSVPPTSDTSTGHPITKKAKNYLKTKRSSWVMPHPTPAVDSTPREGLNQAYNYFTTGSMKNPVDPETASELYQAFNLACAILVLVDEQSDEFHACQLHIDYVRNDVSHRIEPVILDDGLVFTKNDIIKVDSDDKACHSTDDHDPYAHMGVLAATRAQNTLHQPSVFINGGDASDMEPVSRHTKDNPLARENLRLKDALNGLRWLLDAQANVKSIKTKILIDSNHHEWLSIFIAENSCLAGLLDWKTLSQTMFSDWDLFLRSAGADKTYKFGDLSIRHGDNEQPSVAAEIFGKYLGGHYHRLRAVGRAISVGPGCRLGPKYLQNSITAWQNQITSITRYKGRTACAPKTVLHVEEREKSRFRYQGTVYEVDFFPKSRD